MKKPQIAPAIPENVEITAWAIIAITTYASAIIYYKKDNQI